MYIYIYIYIYVLDCCLLTLDSCLRGFRPRESAAFRSRRVWLELQSGLEDSNASFFPCDPNVSFLNGGLLAAKRTANGCSSKSLE